MADPLCPPACPRPDTLTPKFMTAVIAAVVVGGIYFGPAGADAPGAGGADVLRHRAAGGAAAPFAAGPCPAGAAQPVLGAGDPLRARPLRGRAVRRPGGRPAPLSDQHRPQDPVHPGLDRPSAPSPGSTRPRRPGRADHRRARAAGPGGRAAGQKSPCRWRFAAQSVAPWAVAQTILGPLLEPLGTWRWCWCLSASSCCRRTICATALCGWPDRATCSAPPWRWTKRPSAFRAIWRCRPSSMPVSASPSGWGFG